MRCECLTCDPFDGAPVRCGGPPREPSLCWDVKVGWVPVREIDPATGRPRVSAAQAQAQELADANVAFNS